MKIQWYRFKPGLWALDFGILAHFYVSLQWLSCQTRGVVDRVRPSIVDDTQRRSEFVSSTRWRRILPYDYSHLLMKRQPSLL